MLHALIRKFLEDLLAEHLSSPQDMGDLLRKKLGDYVGPVLQPYVWERLPELADRLITFLDEQAAKTDNEIDDQVVEALSEWLSQVFAAAEASPA